MLKDEVQSAVAIVVLPLMAYSLLVIHTVSERMWTQRPAGLTGATAPAEPHQNTARTGRTGSNWDLPFGSLFGSGSLLLVAVFSHP